MVAASPEARANAASAAAVHHEFGHCAGFASQMKTSNHHVEMLSSEFVHINVPTQKKYSKPPRLQSSGTKLPGFNANSEFLFETNPDAVAHFGTPVDLLLEPENTNPKSTVHHH